MISETPCRAVYARPDGNAIRAPSGILHAEHRRIAVGMVSDRRGAGVP